MNFVEETEFLEAKYKMLSAMKARRYHLRQYVFWEIANESSSRQTIVIFIILLSCL